MRDPNDRDRQQREFTEELRRSANARADRKRREAAAPPTPAAGEAIQELHPAGRDRVRQLTDPEEPILATIRLPEGLLNITLASTASAVASQDLIQQAIVGLIEHGPTCPEPVAKDWAALDFYTAILSALARQYVVDCPPAQEMPIYELLATLINDLRTADRLREVVHAPHP